MVPCKYLTWLIQDLISDLEVWIYVMTDCSGDLKPCDGLSASISQDRHDESDDDDIDSDTSTVCE